MAVLENFSGWKESPLSKVKLLLFPAVLKLKASVARAPLVMKKQPMHDAVAGPSATTASGAVFIGSLSPRRVGGNTEEPVGVSDGSVECRRVRGGSGLKCGKGSAIVGNVDVVRRNTGRGVRSRPAHGK